MKRRDFLGKVAVTAGLTAVGNVLPAHGAQDKKTGAAEMRNSETQQNSKMIY